jgi:hypothetical protein
MIKKFVISKHSLPQNSITFLPSKKIQIKLQNVCLTKKNMAMHNGSKAHQHHEASRIHD